MATPPTNAERIAKLRALYDVISDNLIESELLGSDTVSVDGVTISNDAAYSKLERLAKIPGVLPVDPFEANSVMR